MADKCDAGVGWGLQARTCSVGASCPHVSVVQVDSASEDGRDDVVGEPGGGEGVFSMM